MPMPSAHIQELSCAVVAPAALAAWNTMAAELVYPTNTAMNPAEMAESLNQLRTGNPVENASDRAVYPPEFHKAWFSMKYGRHPTIGRLDRAAQGADAFVMS